MKAVLFSKHGGPEVLEWADAPDPSPKPDEILVKVLACSINHLDIWIRQGMPAYSISLPHISGCDVVGVVEKLGQQAGDLRQGDLVLLAPGLSCGACEWCASGNDNLCVSYGIRGAKTDGGYAQYAVAKAKDAIPLPAGVQPESAAAFPLVFLTAWHMLVTRAKLQEGQTVLVHAAGSGVGHAAVQIAKYCRAKVIATVGHESKVPKAKALGAGHVIQYKKEDVLKRVKALTDGRGVDVVVEHIGPEVWETSIKALAKNGRLVTCGATSGPQAGLDLRYLFSRQLSVLGAMMGTRRELDLLVPLLISGVLAPVVDTVFPLKEARAAQERILNRDIFGKFVLKVS